MSALKLEVGKTYVTRDGRLAEVVARNDAPLTPWAEFVTFVDDSGTKLLVVCRKDGRSGPGSDHPFDLIREHREPMMVWVNVHSNGVVVAYPTEQSARACVPSGAARIAVPFREVVE